MSDCVCCSQGCPKDGAVAHKGERWCQQCQKDGCTKPRLESKEIRKIVIEGPRGRALVTRLFKAKFRVLSLSTTDPARIFVYEFDAEALKDYLDGNGEHAEYVLAIEPLDKRMLDLVGRPNPEGSH
jgi:hypothetical protein